MKKQLFKHVLLLLLGACSVTFAQQKVTGKVSDKSGEALIGVSVMVKGTTVGTTTDVEGNYTVNAKANQTLTFSYIGYTAQEIAVGNQSIINVTLEEDENTLSEVVVTGMGISKERAKLGYATSSISAEQITQTASPTFATALYGKAPGLTIGTTPGGATSGSSITIRGLSSITGNTQPLIVMDGMPIRSGSFANTSYWSDQRIQGNGLNDINPEDIADLTILKGASAAALYGSEAGNGVIIITTKSGKGKKGLGVDFNASYNYDQPAFLPKYQNVRGSGYTKAIGDAGQDDDMFIYDDDGTRRLINTTLNFGPAFDGKPIKTWNGMQPYKAQAGIEGLFQTALSSSAGISISNASNFGNFRLSYTRQDNGSITPRAKSNKNAFSLNSTLNIGKRSQTNIVVNYINQTIHNRAYKIDRMVNNFGGMMKRAENPQWYLDRNVTSQGYRYVLGSNASLTPDENITDALGFQDAIMEYVYRMMNFTGIERSNRIIANIMETYKITDDLSIRGKLGTDLTAENDQTMNPTERPLSLYAPSGYYRESNNIATIVYGDVFLTYDKKITPDINMTLLGGYTARKEYYRDMYEETNGGLSSRDKFDITASYNQARPGSIRDNDLRKYFTTDALVGSASFNYKDYLNIEGTIRHDRTSVMNPLNNAFTYPSVNAAFIISDAFNLPKDISFSKLRASWGMVGQYPKIYEANIAYTQGNYGTQIDKGQPFNWTQTPTTFGNDNIKPERKKEIEFGLETEFLNGRFGFDIAYYNAQIFDQILPVTVAASSGARSVLTNIGILRNQGLELMLKANPIRSNNLNWNITLNLAKNANKVEKLANDATELLHSSMQGNAEIKSVVGRPMGDIYARPVLTNENGEKVVGPDGLYQLSTTSWELIANAMPDVTGGLINNFAYKNLSLSIISDFQIGGAVMPSGIAWQNSRGMTEESLTAMDASRGGISYYLDENGKGVKFDGSVGPNGEKVYNDGMLMDGVTLDGKKNTNVVSQAYYYYVTYNWGSPENGPRYGLFVKKNHYAKLREATLTYRFPASFVSKLKMQNLSISGYGRNLFFFYRNIKNMDPEQTTAGTSWINNITNAGNGLAYRSFGLKLNASF